MIVYAVAIVSLLLIASLDFSTSFVVSSKPSKFSRPIPLANLPNDNTVIREAVDDYDILRAANFVSDAMYSSTMPVGQRKELARLEKSDLSDRYGPKLKRKFPAVLLLVLEDEEIIGCVGLDCQVYIPSEKRFRKYKPGIIEYAEDATIAPVLANLATRRDRRKRGLGKQLIKSCEDVVKAWGYDEIFLLVDSQNTPARKLYQSQGYTIVFEDDEATCVAEGTYSLVTQPCVNLCYRKNLRKVNPVASAAGGMVGFFSSFFKKK